MRPIKLTPEYIQQLKTNMLEKLENSIKDIRLGTTKNLELKLPIDEFELDTPIIVNYTGLAWAKQSELVRTCSSEIAWHGLVRTDSARKYFEIYDILVYPQSVSSVTVNTDEKAYEAWKANLNDEQFNALRFQAHSHVNMAPNPSPVDRTLYDKFLQNMGNNSFFMFMIVNKAHNMHMEIYDLQNNAFYDNGDILLTVEGEDLDTWYGVAYDTNIKKPVHPINSTVVRAPAPINPAPGYTPPGYGVNLYGGSSSYIRDYFEDEYYGNLNEQTKQPTKGRGRPPKGGKK